MFWAEDIPRFTATDADGRTTEVASVAGRIGPVDGAPAPAAAGAAARLVGRAGRCRRRDLDDPDGARRALDAAGRDGRGHAAQPLLLQGRERSASAGQAIDGHAAIELRADAAVELVNGDEVGEFLCCRAARSASRWRSTAPS